MKIQKKHLRIVVIALAAAILYNVYVYLSPANPPASAARPLLAGAPQPDSPATTAPVDPRSIPAPPAVDLKLDPKYDRDPFLFGDETRDVRVVQPAAAPVGPDPIIRSILFSSGRRLAMVDGGKIVKVGDRMGAGEIVEIASDAVVIRTPTGERRRVGIYGGGAQGITR